MRLRYAIVRQLTAWIVLGWPVLLVAGAGSQPAASQPSASPQQRLKDHVCLLASPALKGREPKTLGSQRARQYIMDRFEECGLKPWGEQDSYELPFETGTNVVGVLPGTDPALAEKFVLVAAHYDHLGMRDGKIHPGATDNASGVAAVLELARQLSQARPGPRRPIAFCAFNSEEIGLLGAQAFTERVDFRKGRIAAMVNIDMLGHETADDEGHLLLELASKGVSRVQQPLREAAGLEGIKLLPIPDSAGGMSSDHAVFQDVGIPYLFFCCGVFEGMHEPTDTADRLNYANMQHDVAVILAGVRSLADQPEKVRPRMDGVPATRPTSPLPSHEPAPL